MTTVKIREWVMPISIKGIGRYEVEISGHVERKDPVKNDACVAASILAQTLVQTLRDREGQFVHYEDKVSDDAYVYILANTDERTDLFLQHAIECIGTGFRMLETSYPDDFYVDWV